MTTTRESIERALAHHTEGGRIKSWLRCHGSHPAEWSITLTDGQAIDLRTVREGVVFCHGLASAEQGARRDTLRLDAGQVTVGDLLMGRTQEQMRDAFDRVKNRENWKLPVDMLIPYSDPWADDDSRAMIDDAVLFYTGAPTDWEQSNVGWHVRAAGYYACIGS